MSVIDQLAHFLAGLGEQRLADVLAARPEAADVVAIPRTWRHAAIRLADPAATVRAAERAGRQELAILQALWRLVPATAPDTSAGPVVDPSEAPDLARADQRLVHAGLGRLAALALAVDDGAGRLVLNPAARAVVDGSGLHFPHNKVRPFLPVLDSPSPVLAPSDSTAARAAAAAMSALDAADRLVGAATLEPIAMLSPYGGIAGKTVQSLAKDAVLPVSQVNLLLHLLHGAQVLEIRSTPAWNGSRRADRAVLAPGRAAPAWHAANAPDRLTALVGVWSSATTLPTAPPSAGPAGGRRARVLAAEASVPGTATVRELLLQLLADLPDGTGVRVDTAAQVAALAEAVTFRRPAAFWDPGIVSSGYWSFPKAADLVEDLLAEAQLLGVTADGALSVLGRALAGGRAPDVAAAAADLVPIGTSVRFCTEDTAMTERAPDPEMARFLSSCARPNTPPGRWTWRFTPATLMGYLESGGQVLDLRNELVRYAGGLPTALEQTISDAEDRFGRVRLVVSGQVLHTGGDQVLADQLARELEFADIPVRRLDGCVLVAGASATQLRAVLHQADLPPAAEDAAGRFVATQPKTRAPHPSGRPDDSAHARLPWKGPEPDPYRQEGIRLTVAALTAGNTADVPGELAPVVGWLRTAAPELDQVDLVALARAAAGCTAIVVDFTRHGSLESVKVLRPHVDQDNQQLRALNASGHPIHGKAWPLKSLRIVVPATQRKGSRTTAIKQRPEMP